MGGALATDPARQARAVTRACRTATLATAMADGSGPYASLVLVAFDQEAAPVLLISRLAEHTKNIEADPRVSLLCDGTAGFDEPLTGPRVTLQGHASRNGESDHRTRYLRRHPSAEMYAGFADFAFYRIEVERAHIVAGFGRIHWLDDYLLPRAPALQQAEAEIIDHMNKDHADAVQLYATRLLGLSGEGWAMCGVDAEGADLIRGNELARLNFEKPVSDAESARVELVHLVKHARSSS